MIKKRAIIYNYYKRYGTRKRALEVAAKMRKSTGLPAKVNTIDKHNHDVLVGYHAD